MRHGRAPLARPSPRGVTAMTHVKTRTWLGALVALALGVLVVLLLVQAAAGPALAGKPTVKPTPTPTPSATTLAALATDPAPWLHLEANSLQPSPLYLGATPRELALGLTPAAGTTAKLPAQPQGARRHAAQEHPPDADLEEGRQRQDDDHRRVLADQGVPRPPDVVLRALAHELDRAVALDRLELDREHRTQSQRLHPRASRPDGRVRSPRSLRHGRQLGLRLVVHAAVQQLHLGAARRRHHAGPADRGVAALVAARDLPAEGPVRPRRPRGRRRRRA